MTKKIIVAIGGGDIKNKTTLKIDEYIANMAKHRAGERRAVALFVGTASHDYMPYFNSFRKTYTSVFDIKADVALTVYKETELSRLEEKINAADVIYVGGGDTKFMIEHWKTSGLGQLIKSAYERGVIIAGLSAGGICWFEDMYTDSEIEGIDGCDYKLMPALGYIKGLACPHYNMRVEDFDLAMKGRGGEAIAIEDDCAVTFEDGVLIRVVSSGGKAYRISSNDGIITKTEIK